jgi:hypothetical protein
MAFLLGTKWRGELYASGWERAWLLGSARSKLGREGIARRSAATGDALLPGREGRKTTDSP